MVVRDANGNYSAVKGLKRAKEANKPSGNTYTDNSGKVFPVYVSKKGKIYIIRTSKNTGLEYKQYLSITAWEDDIRNKDNKEYVVEAAFNLGIDVKELTQKQFDKRYKN